MLKMLQTHKNQQKQEEMAKRNIKFNKDCQ